jgi:hypothetical protein
MRSKSAILVLVYLFIGICVTYADEEIENLFDNPGFEEGKGKELQSVPGWKIYAQQNATGHLTIDTDEAIEGDQCLFVKVESVPAGGRWNLRLDHDRRFAVKKGKTYTMSFWLKGDPGPITLSPSRAEQNAAGEWGNLASKEIMITDQWEEYYLTFTSTEDRLIMWQLLISNPKQEYYVDYARCYEGDYVEGEIKPLERAVLPSGKLTTRWGYIRSN